MDTQVFRKDYEQFFTMSIRTDGNEFIKLKDEAPEDLRYLVRQIHFDLFGGCLPNDWVYDTIHSAFNDLQHENLDNLTLEPDAYYSKLYKWFGEPFAHQYCNEAIDEIGPFKNIYDAIGHGQYLAIERIYGQVNQFINEES
jgi:hypothetical protein